MRQGLDIFALPRKNDAAGIEAHQNAVFQHFADIFYDIDQVLRLSLPKVKNTFALHEGPIDLAVHAPWTRYLVRLELAKKSKELFDEDDIEFDMIRVANCGLCVRTTHGDVRILKSSGEGLPKALSDARIRFVANNQMSFSFAQEVLPKLEGLNLFALWRMDADHSYLGLDIACPKKADDKGIIECYWIARWRKSAIIAAPRTPQVPVAPDLDEIVAVPARDIKTIA